MDFIIKVMMLLLLLVAFKFLVLNLSTFLRLSCASSRNSVAEVQDRQSE